LAVGGSAMRQEPPLVLLRAPLYGPGEIAAVARTSFNLELYAKPGPVMRGVDLLPGLSSARCPMLVVAGDVGPVSGVHAAAEMVGLVGKIRRLCAGLFAAAKEVPT
jgi:hypothetical protein